MEAQDDRVTKSKYLAVINLIVKFLVLLMSLALTSIGVACIVVKAPGIGTTLTLILVVFASAFSYIIILLFKI